MNNPLSRMQAYLDSAARGESAPFVTISRQAGAGGITIARLAAERLRERDAKSGYLNGWTVFDKTLVDETIRDRALSKQLGEFVSEDALSLIHETLQDLFGLHPLQWTLTRQISETILRLAAAGRSILVGCGANILTGRLSGGLRVRLVGSVKKRTEHLKEYFGFDTAEAADFLRREDDSRRRYVKKYFGADIDDPLAYDLILNTDDIPYEQAAALIAYAVRHRAPAPSPLEA